MTKLTAEKLLDICEDDLNWTQAVEDIWKEVRRLQGRKRKDMLTKDVIKHFVEVRKKSDEPEIKLTSGDTEDGLATVVYLSLYREFKVERRVLRTYEKPWCIEPSRESDKKFR